MSPSPSSSPDDPLLPSTSEEDEEEEDESPSSSSSDVGSVEEPAEYDRIRLLVLLTVLV